MEKIKNKRSLIYTIVMSIMLVICVASIATLAYFTSQKSTSKEIKFGTIEVDVTSANGNLVTTASQNAVLMPGDTATVNFTVENKGEACYYLVLLTTPGATEIDLGFPTGLYAGAVDNAGTNKIATPTSTTYRVGSFAASSAAEGKSFTYNENVAFSLTDIGNEAQGKSVTVCVTVVAIQQANMEAGSDTLSATEYAYQELYKMLYPSEAVVIGGVNYYYESATDSFKVGNGFGTGLADTTLTNITIEGIILGRNVKIAESAFSSCSDIKNVIIKNGVTNIETSAFMSCSSLESINFPESITNIGGGAFSNCELLKNVTIPNNVTKIQWATFSDCYSLEIATISNSVTVIEAGAFVGCSDLSTVNYDGTMAEWNNILIDNTENTNAVLYTASIICSDGTMINGVKQ